MANLGGYGTVSTETLFAFGGRAAGRDFIYKAVPTLSGTITSFSVYIQTVSSNPYLRLKIWRQNGSNLDFVGQSQAVAPTTLGVMTFTLDTPIVCRKGDYVGVNLISVAGVYSDKTVGGPSVLIYKDGNATTSQAESGFTVLTGYDLLAGINGNFSTITITIPKQYQTYQRTENISDLSINGITDGDPVAIEASFNNGSYITIDSAVVDNAFSGVLEDQLEGQGTLIVRYTNDTTISASVSYIGIGDIYVIIGNSIAQGYLTEYQSYSHPTLKATMFRQDDVWRDLADPSDTSVLHGSFWPLLATYILADQSVPVAFVTTATGSTDLAALHAEWQKGNSAYTEMASQIVASGINGIKAFISHFGAVCSVATNPISQVDYNVAIDQLSTDLTSDYPGTKLLIDQVGEVTMGSPTNRRLALDNIRAAVVQAWNDNNNVLRGPVLYDIETDDGAHYWTTSKGAIIAARWWRCLKEHFYEGASGYSTGPVISDVKKLGSNQIIVYFSSTSQVSPTTSIEGFRVLSDTTVLTIASINRYSATSILITMNDDFYGYVTVSLGSENDGAGKSVPYDSTSLLPAEIGLFDVNVGINTFSSMPLRDNNFVISTIDIAYLLTKMSDPYFISAINIDRVDIYYMHNDGRQEKRIIHNKISNNLTGRIRWSKLSKSGLWRKNRVLVYDTDGTIKELNRNIIGTEEDLNF
jgi:hypothetical protein